jgi:hypothetical protein
MVNMVMALWHVTEEPRGLMARLTARKGRNVSHISKLRGYEALRAISFSSYGLRVRVSESHIVPSVTNIYLVSKHEICVACDMDQSVLCY